MVIDYADRLEQRIDDGGTHEGKVAAPEIFTDPIGQLRCGTEVGKGSGVMDDPGSVDPVPEIGRERPKLGLDPQDGLRVGTGAIDLEPVSNNSFVLAEPFEAPIIERSNLGRVERRKGMPVSVAAVQDGGPGKAGFGGLED